MLSLVELSETEAIRYVTKDNGVWAAALQNDRKAKDAFRHSVRIASALNGPITTACTAHFFAYNL